MHRHARRLTLEELSERCTTQAGLSISAAALLRVEQGKRGVEAGDLVALAMALQVTVPELLAPSVDEGLDEILVGDGHPLTQDDYLGVIGAKSHAAHASVADGADAVVLPAEQFEAIVAAFAAVGAAAGEAARQFSVVTNNGTSLHAIATAAGGHARRPGGSGAQLRQAGFTTEQLRDRFGPSTALADATD
jgi:transcriptional regulator with XRE-family HTH domain